MINLKNALKLARKTQTDLGKHLNVSQATISRYISDDIVAPSDVVLKTANYLNVTTDYLLGRTDQPDDLLVAQKIKADFQKLVDSLVLNSNIKHDDLSFGNNAVASSGNMISESFFDPNPDSDFATVPLLEDAIAAGKPIYISDRVENRLYFTKEFLRSFVDPFLIRVGKDQRSMEPTILPGDLLLIDRRIIEKCSKNDIYAVRHPEEGGTIKRCVHVNDKLILVSDNPAYSNVIIHLEKINIKHILVGTVVWIGRELKSHKEK